METTPLGQSPPLTCSASLVADAIAFAKQRGGDCSMLVAYAALKETGMLAAYMGSQWQPIETAPDIGKHTMLVFCSHWRNTYTAYREAGLWFHAAAGNKQMTEVPTHWMALPCQPNAPVLATADTQTPNSNGQS